MISHSISPKKTSIYSLTCCYKRFILQIFALIFVEKRKKKFEHTQVAQKVSNTQNKEEILLKTIVSTVKNNKKNEFFLLE